MTFDAGRFDLAFEPGDEKDGKISHKEGAPDVFMEVDDVDDVYRKQGERGARNSLVNRKIRVGVLEPRLFSIQMRTGSSWYT